MLLGSFGDISFVSIAEARKSVNAAWTVWRVRSSQLGLNRREHTIHPAATGRHRAARFGGCERKIRGQTPGRRQSAHALSTPRQKKRGKRLLAAPTSLRLRRISAGPYGWRRPTGSLRRSALDFQRCDGQAPQIRSDHQGVTGTEPGHRGCPAPLAGALPPLVF